MCRAVPIPGSVNLDKHPLLCVLESLVANAVPHPTWRDGESFGVGVAQPLGAEWLIARRNKQRIEVQIGGDAPIGARASLVMEGTTASALLERTAELGEPRVFGDAQFLGNACSPRRSQTTAA